MRVSSRVAFLVVVLAAIWPIAMSAQQATSDSYSPPLLTTERLMEKDPTFNPVNQYKLAADPAKFRATLEQQAASGKLVAEMLLGEMYIPPECTFLPYKTAPDDCPDDPLPNNLTGLTRSFNVAIHWLTLASQQGSGEASEILAQLIERTIKSGTPSHYQMTDVAHYHAVARSQGFDLQDVEISCYALDGSYAKGRLTMEEMPGEFQFTAQQLEALHAAGASGTLRFQSASIQPNLNVLLKHPEGPKVQTRIILSRPASKTVLVPMADRADVVYLQMGDRIVTFPSTFPALRRKYSFHPPTAKDETGATFQEIDGSFGGGCQAPALPSSK